MTLTWGEQHVYAGRRGVCRSTVDTAATLDPLWQIGRGGNMLTRYLANAHRCAATGGRKNLF